MTTLHYATYCDHQYLSRALALHASLVRHSPPFVLWLLCLDEEVVRVLTALGLPHMRLIPLAELERSDLDLLDVKGSRLPLEYYWTCGPAFLVHVFERAPEVEMLTYLDADLFFFDSPAPIYDELAGNSILLVEHRGEWDPDDSRKIGRFNLGLLVLRRTPTGMACLRRWREQCVEWCFDRFEAGKFGDQGYLDGWPEQFPQVTVLKHEGADMAPWNVLGAPLRCEDGRVRVNAVPMIAYHFSKVRRVTAWLYELHDWRFHRRRLPRFIRQHIYGPYLRAVHAAELQIRQTGGRVPSGSADERAAAQQGERRRLATSHQLGLVSRSRRFMIVTRFFMI